MDKTNQNGRCTCLLTSSGIWRLLETVCQWGSAAAVLALLVELGLGAVGVPIPFWIRGAVTVALSAAVGYLTNFFAIEMLFKPYERTGFHYLSLISFGLWKQGLVPSKKDEIAKELGHQIETKLIDPSKIADEFCDTVGELIQNQPLMNGLQIKVQQLLRDHEGDIIEFLYPQLESSILQFIEEKFTAPNVEQFFQTHIVPYLLKDETRRFLAGATVQFAKSRSAQIMEIIKSQARSMIYDYLSKNVITRFAAGPISDGITESIQWDKIEWQIYDALRSEKTQQLISNEIVHLFEHIRERFSTPKFHEQLAGFIAMMKKELRLSLQTYLREALPRLTNRLIESDSLWQWVRNDMLPKAKPALEQWVSEHGRDLVIDKLRISERVSNAVDRQDIREFHTMINSLSREHLGAIQVLGYILGALIGSIQLLATYLAV